MHNSDKRKSSGAIKKANSFIYWILRCVFIPVMYLLFRYKFDRKTSKGIKRPCLILSNHQTVLDAFAVGVGFRFGINYVASDTIFRHGFKSKLMMILARPIPFSKGSSDSSAIRNMMSVIKSGGCVGMFPSANQSFFGSESTIVPGIGKLARKFGVPLVLVQLRGGFLTKPRWKAMPNKGKMRGAVSRVVSAEELAAMSPAEIDDIIFKELNFNDFEYNKTAKIVFRGKHRAEYLESVLFYCPECHSLSGLHSQGNEFFCRDCGMGVRLGETIIFEKIKKAEKVPDTILEWSAMQLNYIKGIDYSPFSAKPLFRDEGITFKLAQRARNETLLGTGTIEFFNDRFTVCGQDFFFVDSTLSLQGVRKLTMYNKDSVYAIESPLKMNLVKYMICGYCQRNKILNIKEEYYGY